MGPDGNLYVSTLFDSTVVKTDTETGAPLGTFASGGGLATAVGVVFGPDGNRSLEFHGARVFDAERKAVNELGKVKEANATIDSVIASLVEVDAELARIAVEDATDNGGAARLLAAAQRHFDRAEGITGANAAERAIQAYRAAWIAAQHSIRKP